MKKVFYRGFSMSFASLMSVLLLLYRLDGAMIPGGFARYFFSAATGAAAGDGGGSDGGGSDGIIFAAGLSGTAAEGRESRPTLITFLAALRSGARRILPLFCVLLLLPASSAAVGGSTLAKTPSATPCSNSTGLPSAVSACFVFASFTSAAIAVPPFKRPTSFPVGPRTMLCLFMISLDADCISFFASLSVSMRSVRICIRSSNNHSGKTRSRCSSIMWNLKGEGWGEEG